MWRRRWIIGGIVAIALLAGLIITLLTTPLYTAVTRIEIARESARVTEFRGVESEVSPYDLEFYQTQYGLLRSPALAEQVARGLKLDRDQQFLSAFDIDLAKVDGSAGNTEAARRVREKYIAVILLRNLAVSPVRGSRLVDINFTSPSAQLSARIANQWANEYIERNLARRFETTSYARKFLEGRLESLRRRLQESETQLVRYASEQGLINLPGTVDRTTGQTVGERSLVGEELASLSQELSAATARRIEAQSELARNQTDGSSTTALQNTAINSLRQKRAEIAADYSKLLVQFEPNYPPAKALQSQLETLDRSIAREESRVGQATRGTFQASEARETALQKEVENLKGRVTDSRQRGIQYNIFQRDVDTNRQLYDGLLQRYKEIGIAGGVGANNISIVDLADVPTRPSRPRVLANLLFALLFGLAASAGVAWLLEQIEEGISDPTDVPRVLNTALLGVSPNSPDGTPLLDIQDRGSALVEAYLSIQTNLDLSTAHGAPKSFSVTSTRPKEGKSITSYALAHSFAKSRRRVVLIDCDMRSPVVHREFELSNEFGVSNFLAGNDDLSRSLHPSNHDNLTIMPAGPQPPNAADLLSGDRLRVLVQRLLEDYDHVVVDSPPVMGLADAPLIASAVEGTIYAVEANSIRASMVKIALQRLRSSNANVLGVVLTKFDSKQSNYGYGYEYGYGYGRGRDKE